MAHRDARQGKWRGNCRMEWVASTLHTTSEHGVSSISTADAHSSAASGRLNWRPPADLNGLVRFAERRNLISARVPSHSKRSLPGLFPGGKAAGWWLWPAICRGAVSPPPSNACIAMSWGDPQNSLYFMNYCNVCHQVWSSDQVVSVWANRSALTRVVVQTASSTARRKLWRRCRTTCRRRPQNCE